MSIFEPALLQEPPKVPPRKPKAAPTTAPFKPAPAVVVKPKLTPPKGPPVPALQKLGFHGGLGDFADSVQRVVDEHVATNGFVPKPGTLLALALTPPAPKPAVVKPPAIDLADADKLLQGLRGHAKGGYDDFMVRHGAQIDALLENPATHAKAAAAVAEAKAVARLDRIQAAGGTPDLKGLAVAGASMPARMSEYTTRATIGFARDVADLAAWGGSGGKEGSASFGHLERTAPALAQVVKGLVYSPVGLAQTASAVAKDLDAANGKLVYDKKTGRMRRGDADLSFKHTRAAAESVGMTFVEDVTNPRGREGYLLLDALGIVSLGAGSVTRLGAASRAGAAGESRIAAFRAPHPTKTKTLSKDGFDAQIRLAQNPLMRLAQERWLDHAQAKLDGKRKHTDLDGNPIVLNNPIARLFPEGSYGSRVAVWASDHNPLAPERIIGRAESIRQVNELKSLAALNVLLKDIAGSATRTERWHQQIPDALYGGLTPPEMIAMESLSYDVSNGLSRLSMLEKNAQTAIEMGLGDPAVWKHRLGLLALARKQKVLEEPTPQFRAAVDAVQRVTAEQEALKIGGIGDRRLSEQTAENRIIKAGAIQEHFPVVAPMLDAHIKAQANFAYVKRMADLEHSKTGEISPQTQARLTEAEERLALDPYPFVDMDDGGIGMRVGDAVVPLNRNTPDSWYFRAVPKDKPQQRIGKGTSRVGTSGLSPQALPAEMRFEFSGSSLIYGDHRIDLHNLAEESLAKASRAFVQWSVWKKAWDNAGEHKPGYIPVRDIRDLPDDLRRALAKFDDETLDTRSANLLPDDLQRALFPDVKDMQAGEHYRWIDPRLLGHAADRPRQTGAFVEGMAKANDVLRPLIFYSSPKYALNAVGNAGMLVLDQGFARSYTNFVKAMSIDKALSPEDFARVKNHVGGGRAESYVSEKSGRINRALAEFWGKLTDERFRYASWIHHAEVKGYKTPEDWHRLLNDGDSKGDLLDVNRRANEALVAFDRMTPMERATLRNFVFVYPWQRGAFLWSFRTVFEHPAKTALLATLGQDAYQDEEWLKTATAWVRRTGFIPLGWSEDGTKLHTWNPISVNTFGTWNDVLQTINAATRGDPYSTMGDMLGPPAQMLMHGLIGMDENGQRYEGPHLEAALKGALTVIPAIAAYESANRDQGKPVTPINIRDREALIRRQNQYLDQAATSPGWLGGYGRLITGPDAWLNMPKQAAAYWRDAPPEARHRHEQDLIDKMVTRQGVYLDRPVPAEVRGAVKDMGGYAWYVKQQLGETNQDAPNPKQSLVWLIDYYQSVGKFDADTAAALRKKADAAPDQEIKPITSQLTAKYGNTGAMGQWQHDVGRVANAVENFDYRIGQLNRLGLSPQKRVPLKEEDRLAYARKYLAYKTGLEALQDAKATPEQIRLYKDANDEPVKVRAGVEVPSPVRFAFSEDSVNEMTARVAGLVNHKWHTMTRAQKAAMGRDVDNTVSEAWSFYDQLVKAIRQRDESVSRDQKLEIAKLTGRKYPGFTQDWLYARKSRVERFVASPLYRTLPDRDLLDSAVLTPARQIVQAVEAAERNGATGAQSDGKAVWKVYLTKKLKPWLKDNPRLARELAPFGDSFLEGLVNRGSA